MKLTETNYDPGKGVFLKIHTEQNIEIKIDHLVKMIENDSCASDTMAELINALGKVNKEYQTTSCYAADNLNEEGKQFIIDMNYFIKN